MMLPLAFRTEEQIDQIDQAMLRSLLQLPGVSYHKFQGLSVVTGAALNTKEEKEPCPGL